MPATKTFWWTQAPFLRLLPFLMAGIAAGWYCEIPHLLLLTLGFIAIVYLLVYAFLPAGLKFQLRAVSGICLLLLLAICGCLIVNKANIRHNKTWFGHNYQAEGAFIAELIEMPVAKPNSIKAVAHVTHLVKNNSLVPASGSIIIYFQKDVAAHAISFGSRILLHKNLQPIQNSGNPGAFDYRRYCLFQDITHQVFLKNKEFLVLSKEGGSNFQRILIQSRLKILAILRTYITAKQELGLAEALLIGFKDDLDKGLVQAYSNTGVVHVIAISGLHLGLIYGLLLLLTRPLRRKGRLAAFILIVSGLWAFTLLAGAQPSVVRSAVMFTCIALGNLIARKTLPLNTLAFSAFVLLCYNPFWLWDLGFQLSYTAVAGILIFYKPLYHLLYFPNKIIDGAWKLVALTLTAQILTLPVSLYHFHQFPALFLLTNLLAVPLSSIILYLEIFLCIFHFIHPAAKALGWLAETLIRWLNQYILQLGELPFAVWDGFSLSLSQVLLLYAAITGTGIWLLTKNKKGLMFSLLGLAAFTCIRTYSLALAGQQRQLVVYHVPKHRAVDFISGQHVFFAGTPALLQESFERNFHLRPARISFHAEVVQGVNAQQVPFGGKTVVLYDSTSFFPAPLPDVLIISDRAKLPKQIGKQGKPQVVLDATVTRYRTQQWQRLCDSLSWPLHDVRTNGAFVMQW